MSLATAILGIFILCILCILYILFHFNKRIIALEKATQAQWDVLRINLDAISNMQEVLSAFLLPTYEEIEESELN